MYFQIYRDILEPIFESVIKRRKVLKYQAFLEKSQWWPEERLYEYQWGELQALLRHACRMVPWYREISGRNGLPPEAIRSMNDFQRWPILTRELILEHQEQLIAEDYRGRTWSKSTGGSTGVPLHFHYTPKSHDWRTAVTRRGYGWAGYREGLKSLHLWGTALGEVPKARQFKESLHHALQRRRYVNCFDWDEGAMRAALDTLNHSRPGTLVAYTNPLYHFAIFLKENKLKPQRMGAIITGAEKLHDFQRALIEEVFGCPVFNTYGSREFMLIASECEHHKGLHIHLENILLEIVRPDGTPAAPGETGDILITDLHNYGMPFLRYRIGDLGVYSLEKCPCGRAHPLLVDIVGRSLDMLQTVDGKWIPGEFFPHLMKDHPGIRQFQVVQNRLDCLEIKYVAYEGKDPGIETLRREIRKVAGEHMELQFEQVREIPLTRTGKFRVTVCNLPAKEAS